MLKENLKIARKNKGLTQEELADKIHVARQTISKWEKGYSVPDADQLADMAEIFELATGDLLGKQVETNQMEPSVSEQLASLNEQFAIHNRRARKNRKIVFLFICIIAALGVFWIGLNIAGVVNKSPKESGSTSWELTLDGEKYVYSITYSKDYQIISSGGDAYVDNHVDLYLYDDANQVAAHVTDYFRDHGGEVKIIEQKGLQLDY